MQALKQLKVATMILINKIFGLVEFCYIKWFTKSIRGQETQFKIC
jgi:hypothetical protein